MKLVLVYEMSTYYLCTIMINIMTPKEKAIELSMKFDKYGETDNAKQCALIAVDELIRDNVQNEKFVNEILNKKFWQQVKTEIKNL